MSTVATPASKTNIEKSRSTMCSYVLGQWTDRWTWKVTSLANLHNLQWPWHHREIDQWGETQNAQLPNSRYHRHWLWKEAYNQNKILPFIYHQDTVLFPVFFQISLQLSGSVWEGKKRRLISVLSCAANANVSQFIPFFSYRKRENTFHKCSTLAYFNFPFCNAVCGSGEHVISSPI